MSFTSLRTEAGLTADEVAAEFGVGADDVAAWEAGREPVPQHIYRSLDILARFASAPP